MIKSRTRAPKARRWPMNTNMPSTTPPIEDHGVVSLGLDFESGVVAFWNKLDIFMGYS